MKPAKAASTHLSTHLNIRVYRFKNSVEKKGYTRMSFLLLNKKLSLSQFSALLSFANT